MNHGRSVMLALGCSFVLSGALTAAASAQTAQAQIEALAGKSDCASHYWGKDRGYAPRAYIKGVALVFARAVCHADREDVKVVSEAEGTPPSQFDNTDVLTWYHSVFHKLGMANDKVGVNTLRHVYTLMIGLGMRETSGRYCIGRERVKDGSNKTAERAEAGLFQTSWGARKKSPTLPDLFKQYSSDQSGCLLAVFREHVRPPAATIRASTYSFYGRRATNTAIPRRSGHSSRRSTKADTCRDPREKKNWGSGEGAAWQKLTKACPAFATEYAAVVVRKSGGHLGEFGPLRKHKAQVAPVCESMLSEVQKLVESNPELCSTL
jgi:hypothetical protein